MQNQAMNDELLKQLHELPSLPGVYIMKDKSGVALYVGKAIDLRKRVLSYFSSSKNKTPKQEALLDKVYRIETMLTQTEKEALLVESNLIKRHRPRYNVVLRDDKSYPSLFLDIDNPFPRLAVVRRRKKRNGFYFGPFTSSRAVRATIKTISQIFKLRPCKSAKVITRTRPCINYQIGICSGCCADLVSREDYRKSVDDAVQFLKGRGRLVIDGLKARMELASDLQQFEQAAALRDNIIALEDILEKQVAVALDQKDRDILGLECEKDAATVAILFVRGGRLIGGDTFSFQAIAADQREIIESFIKQRYAKEASIPDEIITPVKLPDAFVLKDWLEDEKGSGIRLFMPLRGDKKRLLDIANKNARQALESYLKKGDAESLLGRLEVKLGLSRLPERIACIDLSHFSGSEQVGAVVAFHGDAPDKSLYWKCRIKSAGASDDYGMLREVIHRRYGKVQEPEPLPDMLVIDGGRGQLGVACRALEELGKLSQIDVIAIAKHDKKRGENLDKVFVPGRKNPVSFNRDNDLLLFLERIRDEAHRFVISYQRKRRSLSLMELHGNV
ncbi:MAG: excinuclease ABC subunit UvrC [Pseudomonadota bacterium]